MIENAFNSHSLPLRNGVNGKNTNIYAVRTSQTENEDVMRQHGIK